MATCILLVLYSMYLKLCKKNRLNRHKRTLARQLRHLAWQKTIAQTKLRRYMYVIYYSCLQLANMNLYLSLRRIYVLMLRCGPRCVGVNIEAHTGGVKLRLVCMTLVDGKF